MQNKRRFKVQVNAPTNSQKHKQLNQSYGGASISSGQGGQANVTEQNRQKNTRRGRDPLNTSKESQRSNHAKGGAGSQRNMPTGYTAYEFAKTDSAQGNLQLAMANNSDDSVQDQYASARQQPVQNYGHHSLANRYRHQAPNRVNKQYNGVQLNQGGLNTTVNNRNMVTLSPHPQRATGRTPVGSTNSPMVAALTAQISDMNQSTLYSGKIQSSRTPVSLAQIGGQASPIKERQKSIQKRQSRNASKKRGAETKSGSRINADNSLRIDPSSNTQAYPDRTKSNGPKVSVRNNAAQRTNKHFQENLQNTQNLNQHFSNQQNNQNSYSQHQGFTTEQQHVNQITQNTQNVHNNYQIIIQNPHTFSVSSGSGSLPMQAQSTFSGSVPDMNRSQNFQMDNYKNIPLKMLKQSVPNTNQKQINATMQIRSPKQQVSGLQSANGLTTGFTASAGGILMSGQDQQNQSLHQIPIPRRQSNLKKSSENTMRDTSIKSSQTRINNKAYGSMNNQSGADLRSNPSKQGMSSRVQAHLSNQVPVTGKKTSTFKFKKKQSVPAQFTKSNMLADLNFSKANQSNWTGINSHSDSMNLFPHPIEASSPILNDIDQIKNMGKASNQQKGQRLVSNVASVSHQMVAQPDGYASGRNQGQFQMRQPQSTKLSSNDESIEAINHSMHTQQNKQKCNNLKSRYGRSQRKSQNRQLSKQKISARRSIHENQNNGLVFNSQRDYSEGAIMNQTMNNNNHNYQVQVDSLKKRQQNQYQMGNTSLVNKTQINPIQYRTLDIDNHKGFTSSYPSSQVNLQQLTGNHRGPNFAMSGSQTIVQNTMKPGHQLNNIHDKSKNQVAMKQKFKQAMGQTQVGNASNRPKQTVSKQLNLNKYTQSYPQCSSMSPKNDSKNYKMFKPISNHHVVQPRTQQNSTGPNSVLVKQLFAPNNETNFSKMLVSSDSSSLQNQNQTIDNSVEFMEKRDIQYAVNNFSSLHEAHNSIGQNQKEFKHLKNSRFRGSVPSKDHNRTQIASDCDKSGQDSFELHAGMIQAIEEGMRMPSDQQQRKNQDQVSLQALNVSRINKNFSPISILDNSQQIISQMGGIKSKGGNNQNSSQGNSIEKIGRTGGLAGSNTDEFNFRDCPKQDIKSKSSSKNQAQNLSEHIRKVNKIQIKKRYTQESKNTTGKMTANFTDREGLSTDKSNILPSNLDINCNDLPEGDGSPLQIILKAQHEVSMNKESIDTVLQLLLKYVSIEPCDAIVHFQIAMIYRFFSIKGYKNVQADNKDLNQEEALLHFEQVIKHQCTNNSAKNKKQNIQQKIVVRELLPGFINFEDNCDIAVVSLFEISKIYIDQKDYYSAEHCLATRAIHYGFLQNDQSFEKNLMNKRYNNSSQASDQLLQNAADLLESTKIAASDSVNNLDRVLTYDNDTNIYDKIRVYQKMVKSIIHLMKRKTDKALVLLESIQTPDTLDEKVRNSPKQRFDDRFDNVDLNHKEFNEFWYMYFTNRAYAYILVDNYKQGIEDLQVAKKYINMNVLDQSSKFNSQLCSILKEPRLSFKKQQLKDQIDINEDKKLAMIEQIEKQFPGSACKEVYKYHSIYLIQVQVMFEMAQSERDERRVFAEMIKEVIQNAQNMIVAQKPQQNPNDMTDQSKNLKELASAAKHMRKNRSQIYHLQNDDRHGDQQHERESQRDNNERRYLQGAQFYEKIATCNIDHPVKFKILQKSLTIINTGLEYNPTDRNLLLTRSYILYYLHNFYEALCDIDAVIELERASSGEEEPNATDLLHKGRCHACLSMFKEAITDFTKVIELDDELFDAYFFRGKCAYLIGDTSQAFLDFQKLILLQPKNPMVHAYAGNLLMTTGSYEDAAKAFTNADSVQQCAFAIYQRARCFLAIGDVNRTMHDLELATEMYERNSDHNQHKIHQNTIVLRDKQCLQGIYDAMQLLQNISIEKVFDGGRVVLSREQERLKNTPQHKFTEDSRNIKSQQNQNSGDLQDFQVKQKKNQSFKQKGDREKSQQSSSIFKDQDIDRPQSISSKERYNERILNINSAKKREMLRNALGVLISTLDDIMLAKNIELRDINNPIGPKDGKATNKGSEDTFKEVSFHLTKIESMFENATQDSRMQQQIIPNVTRIKIEKLRALRRYQAKHQLMMHNRAQKKKSSINLLVFNLDDDPVDQQMKDSASKICPWSYYMENLFSLDDIYLYRAVLKFYSEDYKGAIKDFKLSFKTKQQYKILDNENQQGNDQLEQLSSVITDQNQQSSSNLQRYDQECANAAALGQKRQRSTILERQTLKSVETEAFAAKQTPESVKHKERENIRSEPRNQPDADKQQEAQSDKTDLSDVGLCSMNKCEMLYNIALCFLQLQNFAKAMKYINQLMNLAPQKYHENLMGLIHILDQIGSGGRVQGSAGKLVEPFSSQHRLCRYFPCVPFALSKQSKQGQEANSGEEPHFDFVARPSFSFPFVKPPNMIPNVDESILWSEFGPDRDEANIPQPWPLWIKNIGENEQIRSRPEKPSNNSKKPKKPEDPTPAAFQFTDTMLQHSESMQSQSYSHLSEIFPDMFGQDGIGSKLKNLH